MADSALPKKKKNSKGNKNKTGNLHSSVHILTSVITTYTRLVYTDGRVGNRYAV